MQACKVFIIALILMAIYPEKSFSAMPDTIAVVPFQVVGEKKNHDLLCYGFPDGVAHWLKQYNQIVVVNRIKLADVLRELALGQTGIVDASQAQKVGKIIPAKSIITGTVYVAGKNLNVNSQLIDVETGELIFEISEKGQLKLDQIFDFQEKVAKQIAARLNLTLSTGKSSKIAKPSMDAYVHFIKALSYFYGGCVDKARKESLWALKIDPAFSQAQSFEEELENAFEELERVMDEMKKED